MADGPNIRTTHQGSEPDNRDVPDFETLETVVLGALAEYWWLGERASRQLASAALAALNHDGYLDWKYAPHGRSR